MTDTYNWKFEPKMLVVHKNNNKKNLYIMNRVKDVDTGLFIYLYGDDNSLDWDEAAIIEQWYERV